MATLIFMPWKFSVFSRLITLQASMLLPIQFNLWVGFPSCCCCLFVFFNDCIFLYPCNTGPACPCSALPASGDGPGPEEPEHQRPHQLHQGGDQPLQPALPLPGHWKQGIHHCQWPQGLLQGKVGNKGYIAVNDLRDYFKVRLETWDISVSTTWGIISR